MKKSHRFGTSWSIEEMYALSDCLRDMSKAKQSSRLASMHRRIAKQLLRYEAAQQEAAE